MLHRLVDFSFYHRDQNVNLKKHEGLIRKSSLMISKYRYLLNNVFPVLQSPDTQFKLTLCNLGTLDDMAP